MRTKIVSKDTSSLLSSEEVKRHCRVDDDYDLSILNVYTSAAENIAEKLTNRMIKPSVVDLFSPTYEPKFFLPYGEASKVVEIKATNVSQEEEVITNYTFNSIDESVTLDEKLFRKYTNFVIRYECGYQIGRLPDAIKQGMLMTIATLYNVREDVSYGLQTFEAPLTAKMLFNLHRINSGG